MSDKFLLLNSIFGPETLFVILIIIAILVVCFTVLPKMQRSSDMIKDETGAKNETEVKFDNVINQIVEREELINDLELVAVISAAIAASTGTSPDEFIVRSIKRAKPANRWQKA